MSSTDLFGFGLSRFLTICNRKGLWVPYMEKELIRRTLYSSQHQKESKFRKMGKNEGELGNQEPSQGQDPGQSS